MVEEEEVGEREMGGACVQVVRIVARSSLCGAKQGHRHEIMQKVNQTKQTSFSPSALSVQLPLILLFVPYANRHNGEKPTAACPSCTASSECIDLE